MTLKVEEGKSEGLFILQTTSSKLPLPFNHLPLQKKLLIVKDKDMSLKKKFLWIFWGETEDLYDQSESKPEYHQKGTPSCKLGFH